MSDKVWTSTNIDEQTYQPSAFTERQSDASLAIGSVELIKSDIRRIWEAPLRVEHFGVRNPDGRIDVEAEIAVLNGYTKLQTFFDQSEIDKLNRQRYLCEYAKPKFTNLTLNNSIIPSGSFLETILSNITMLYRKPAVRKIMSTTDNDAYQDILHESGIDNSAKLIHKLLKLHNMIAVRPVLKNHLSRQEIQYQILTPDRFMIQLDDNDEITKLMYHGKRSVDNVYQDVIYVFTNDNHYYLDVHGNKYSIPGNDDMINPYGVIPFTVMTLDKGYFSGGAYDIVEAVLKYNYYDMLLVQEITDATANIAVFNFDPNRKVNSVSPHDLFIVDAMNNDTQKDPKITFASSTPFIEEILKVQNDIYKKISTDYGIPTYRLVSDKPTELSGKALREIYRPLEEKRLEDAEIMRAYERELAYKTALVAYVESKAHRYTLSKPIDPNSVYDNFTIDFYEPDYENDPLASLEYDIKRRAENLISHYDIVRKHNQDIRTDEEAAKFVANNKFINDKYKVSSSIFNSDNSDDDLLNIIGRQ